MDDAGKGRLNLLCMKIQFCFVGIFALVTLAVAAPHTWMLKTGNKVKGDYFTSGATTVVVKRDGTNCLIKISDLATNQLPYLAEMQAAQKRARLDVEAKQMQLTGMTELTPKFLENFPEKADGKTGWMDCEFLELENIYASENPSLYLGFSVQDKNGDCFGKCIAEKIIGENPNRISNPLIEQISKLKRGDKIRLIGEKSALSFDDDMKGRWIFSIDKVEIIETAAEKKAREDAAEDPPSPDAK
jgi:hypothetical protein